MSTACVLILVSLKVYTRLYNCKERKKSSHYKIILLQSNAANLILLFFAQLLFRYKETKSEFTVGLHSLRQDSNRVELPVLKLL